MRLNRRLRSRITKAGYRLVGPTHWQNYVDRLRQMESLNLEVTHYRIENARLKEQVEGAEVERRISDIAAERFAERAIGAEIELANMRPVTAMEGIMAVAADMENEKARREHGS